jgi:hypothetical protein
MDLRVDLDVLAARYIERLAEQPFGVSLDGLQIRTLRWCLPVELNARAIWSHTARSRARRVFLRTWFGVRASRMPHDDDR